MTSPAVSRLYYKRFGSILGCTALSAAVIHRVLELGCGDQVETAGYAPDTRIVGIDIDATALRRARAAAPNTGPSAAIRLAQADITRLPLASRQANFDLIVVRHPDVDARPSDWRQAISAAPGWLALDGRLLITCYAPHEAETLRGWIASTALVGIAVDESQLVPADLSGRDRFALVYGKANASRSAVS